MLFGCVKQNINDSSEKLKLIYIKNFLSYAIKTSELKNIEKSVEQTVQALTHSLLEILPKNAF